MHSPESFDWPLPTDLIINGADIDVVAYAHEQNSGEQLEK